MTNLYKLNVERCMFLKKETTYCKYTNPFSFFLKKKIVDGLAKFRRELEVTRDEKKSQEKEALQKAASLRTELTVC